MGHIVGIVEALVRRVGGIAGGGENAGRQARHIPRERIADEGRHEIERRPRPTRALLDGGDEAPDAAGAELVDEAVDLGIDASRGCLARQGAFRSTPHNRARPPR